MLQFSQLLSKPSHHPRETIDAACSKEETNRPQAYKFQLLTFKPPSERSPIPAHPPSLNPTRDEKEGQTEKTFMVYPFKRH